jgi:hypothetical protein
LRSFSLGSLRISVATSFPAFYHLLLNAVYQSDLVCKVHDSTKSEEEDLWPS